MASNAEPGPWRVKFTSLPESSTLDQLSEVFRLRASRIFIPAVRTPQTGYAWINNFKSERDANAFVLQQAHLEIANITIKCEVVECKRGNTETQYKTLKGLNNIQPLIESPSTRPTPRPTEDSASARHPKQDTQESHEQHKHGNAIRRQATSVTVVPETSDSKSERQPCPYANRGMCRHKADRCKYSHKRCQNYSTCSQPACRLAHAPRVQSPSGPNPESSTACADGAQCTDYKCISNHPPGRPKKCSHGNRCHTKTCGFLHPKTDANECPSGANCQKWNCQKVHPVERRLPCPDANHCQRETCRYIHPKPNKVTSVEVVTLSDAQYNFLGSFGSKILDKIRAKPGMNAATINDGKLRLEGDSSTVTDTNAYVKQTLHEQHVTVTSTLWKYLQTKAKSPLWSRFIIKHRLGTSFLVTSTSTPKGPNQAATTQNAVYDQGEKDRNPGHSEDDDDEHDDDDARSITSTATSASASFKLRFNRGQQLIQVTLCSDLEEILSKAIDELGNYSLSTESWPLTQDEKAYILSQPQKEKPHPQNRTRGGGQFATISSFLNGLVRPWTGPIVQVFAENKHGIWHVKVRGFKNHVKTAVSKIKTHLNDNVQSELQLPVSRVTAIFLRTKASSDITKLEKTHSIKITTGSSTTRAHANDEGDGSTPDCLKLTGSSSHIKLAQEHVENFLENLCEQEKEFACLGWDVSNSIAQLLRERLEKIQDSADCEAVGCTKSYTALERRDTAPKVTISIVGFNEEAVDNVAEQCQDIVEGHVVWKPSTDEFRAIVVAFFVKKSTPIDEFQQQWDTRIRLDRDTSTITISARSKMIADEIREALLSLGAAQRPRVTRASEFIPVEPLLRRFVHQRITSVLAQAKARRIFVESKNPRGLTLNGESETVAEFKRRIIAIIDEIQGNVVTRRLPLSSLESNLLRAHTYGLLKRIERETTTSIRDVTVDSHASLLQPDDNDGSSTVVTVANSRGQTITVTKGDIVKVTNVDAIISTSNGALFHAGGVNKAIADAAGPALDTEWKQLIANNGGLPISAGQAVKTTAGNLPFKCVIHAISPQYVNGNQQERRLLFASILKSLQLAEDEAYGSVALPAVSFTTYGFLSADRTNIVVRAVKQFFADHPQSKVRTVTLLDIDEPACSSFAREVTIDHTNGVLDNDDDLAECEMSPLTAKWCWQDPRDEKTYTDADARQIETAFQQYLTTFVAGDLQITADNLSSGTIVNYSIHFHPDIKPLLTRDPNALDGRLLCGYQMRVDTGFKRNIIRYPVAEQAQQQSRAQPADYRPKPLDAYTLQAVTGEEYWTITGIANATVEQAHRAIRAAIHAATIAEPFSAKLNKDFDEHRKELSKIATELQVEISFQQEGSGQLPMILKGFKANVAEVKLKITLYAQDLLVMQVENDDELRIPKEWGAQKDGCKLVDIPKTDPCFVRIEQRMKETLPEVKIEKVERVQNLRMWDHYAFRRRELKKELRLTPDLQVEMELFHGTRNTPPNEVYNGEYGFDMTFSTSGMWGIGTYFAQNASYSCGSYAYTVGNGKKQVFLAQVLTGDVHDCPKDQSLRRPPKKNETVSGLRYNSISGTTGGSKVYIVYENRVAYPTYLITFNA